MKRTSRSSTKCSATEFQARLLMACLSMVVLFCSAASSQDATVTKPNAVLGIPATHVLGFEGVAENSKGKLYLQDHKLQFQKQGGPLVLIDMSAIQSLSLGESEKQVGGGAATVGKAAVPFGGGRVISLFSHKKYDTLSLEYVDGNRGLHGAIFQLAKGDGEALNSELIASGADLSLARVPSAKEQNSEAGNEKK